MHVDGLSRTEARHLAAAMKASLGVGVKVEREARVKVEGEVGKVGVGEGEDLFPDMLVVPYADCIPAEDIATLCEMWCREGVIINGGWCT